MSKANRPVHIYLLRCPYSRQPRYVGRSYDPDQRLRGHLKDARRASRQTRVARWIRFLARIELIPLVETLDVVSPDISGLAESFWIRAYREQGHQLLNLTDGGDGVVNPSAEIRAQISAKLTGRVVPPDVVARRAAAQRGRVVRPEVRKRISLALMGHGFSPEARQKMSDAKKGIPRGPMPQWQRDIISTKKRERDTARRLAI